MNDDFDFDVDKLTGNALGVVARPVVSIMNVKNETDDQRKLRMLLQMERLNQSCSLCNLGRQACIEHDSEFDPHVFSTMNVSKWMIVGQNPGYNECLKHEPFVGDAGEFFNKHILKNGLHRSKFYISNVVKCHTIGNELPNDEQIEVCSSFLKMEIMLLNPTLVITLGASAFGAMCPNLVYSSSLGKIHLSERFNCKVFPIYHPSPRNMSNLDRLTKFKLDIKKLCKLIKSYERAN